MFNEPDSEELTYLLTNLHSILPLCHVTIFYWICLWINFGKSDEGDMRRAKMLRQHLGTKKNKSLFVMKWSKINDLKNDKIFGSQSELKVVASQTSNLKWTASLSFCFIDFTTRVQFPVSAGMVIIFLLSNNLIITYNNVTN